MSEQAVDVIILDLDGGSLLDACLDSIAAQTTPPQRVIVWDNGSTVATARRLTARPLPIVEVRRSEKNLGFTGGNNAAMRLSAAPFVALINNDVVLDRDWLTIVLAAMAGDDRLAAVQCVLRRDGATIDGAGIDISDGTFRQAGHGARLASAPKHAAEAWGVSATATLYRRTALHDVAVDDEVFDRRLFAYYEDVDLCARLHAHRWRTAVLPIAKATHAGSRTASRLGRKALRLRTRNRYRVARAHRGVGRMGALLSEDARRIARCLLAGRVGDAVTIAIGIASGCV
ncbi:MAG TPA: glycosyltransferase family 2 protein [Thermoanaerobaculia bacterium]|nr:glycosyltransferase family 2 protein [Thermoanaerobaculia bacterium]